eukprot:COSAG05_NODE_4603_length_1442_cov_1.318690_2_plen_88_part_00
MREHAHAHLLVTTRGQDDRALLLGRLVRAIAVGTQVAATLVLVAIAGVCDRAVWALAVEHRNQPVVGAAFSGVASFENHPLRAASQI